METRVKKIIADLNGLNVLDIQSSSRLIEDLDLDSLSAIELAMALEDEFGIKIPDEDAEKFLTVGDIVKYVRDQTGD